MPGLFDTNTLTLVGGENLGLRFCHPLLFCCASRLRDVIFPPIGEQIRSCSLPLRADYNVHVYMRQDGLAGTVTADLEYPPRVAFVLLTQVSRVFRLGLALRAWVFLRVEIYNPKPLQ